MSGPPGTGKTTLAHDLGRRLGCPVVVRDEIKQGMVLAAGHHTVMAGDPFDYATLDVFFRMLSVLLKAGVTVVAEAAYQDRLWRPGLTELGESAELRIIKCTARPYVAYDRIRWRLAHDPHRAAHADRELLDALASGRQTLDSFEWITLDAPTLVVDTSDGYRPQLDDIVGFATDAK
ncbi:AAA family ATPase [Phytohabitans flavus]|uniref:AAA family ATPase n=1 Tax=Phytohabitans flavus TaxID=1076124 RepID=UPI0018D85D95|nr:AAA family ATPase [Phytohabitans flavus]